ncbi:hypothetical protein Tco_0889218, partial [Tanacetum coccineum]
MALTGICQPTAYQPRHGVDGARIFWAAVMAPGQQPRVTGLFSIFYNAFRISPLAFSATLSEINTKIDEYKGLISEMEVMNKLKKNDDVGKLKVKVESKCKSFSDLIERLNALKVEKNGLTMHEGVRSLVDDVDKVNNELTLKMAKLKEKVKGSAKLFQKEE